MADGSCPCCGRHCSLDDPHCDRGREYAKTGVMPSRNDEERGEHGRHDHGHDHREHDHEHHDHGHHKHGDHHRG